MYMSSTPTACILYIAHYIINSSLYIRSCIELWWTIIAAGHGFLEGHQKSEINKSPSTWRIEWLGPVCQPLLEVKLKLGGTRQLSAGDGKIVFVCTFVGKCEQMEHDHLWFVDDFFHIVGPNEYQQNMLDIPTYPIEILVHRNWACFLSWTLHLNVDLCVSEVINRWWPTP